MLPPWLSALSALLLYLTALVWLVSSRKRRLIHLTWRQVYLALWVMAGCLAGLGYFSVREEHTSPLVFALVFVLLIVLSIFAGEFVAGIRHLNYDSWGERFLPFLNPRTHKLRTRAHR